MLKKFAIICVAAFALSGCAQAITAVSTKIQTDSEFNELVLEDVQAAIVLATQSGDELGLMCWTYLEAFTRENAPDLENPAGKDT